jgi:hypothetical protein
MSALVAALAQATTAEAFCRTTTCDPATECEYDRLGCTTVGLPLEWNRACVSFSVHRDGSSKRGISYTTAHNLAQAAFDKWTEADCDGDTPSIVTSDRSPALCGEPEYNSDNGNANVIMFRDNDWPYAGANATLALTTITFNFETGEIFDSDIEVNSYRTPLTTGDVGIEFDLQSILTHETGHFLGLSHTHVSDATMYLEYSEGHSTLRDLHEDDVSGICETYPPDREADSKSCEPRHGYSPDCKPPPDDGCTLGSPPLTSRSSSWLLLVLGVLVVNKRRRSSRA